VADGFKLNFLVLTSALNASVDHAVLLCGHTRPDNCMMAKAGHRVQGLTLVHFAAQPEPIWTLKTTPKPLNTP